MYLASVLVSPISTPYWIFVTIFTSLLDKVIMLRNELVLFSAIFILKFVPNYRVLNWVGLELEPGFEFELYGQ